MEKLRNGQIARCQRKECKGSSQENGKSKKKSLVKPDIVFFGESLPSIFFSSLKSLSSCDLLLVWGTSLQVQPFASIVNRVPSSCPRVLFNLEKVGELADFSGGGGMMGRMNEEGFDFDGATVGGKDKTRDLFVEGKCDENVLELVKLCGWEVSALERRPHFCSHFTIMRFCSLTPVISLSTLRNCRKNSNLSPKRSMLKLNALGPKQLVKSLQP